MGRAPSIILTCLLCGAGSALAQEHPYAVTEERAACAAFDPLRRPHFGDLHIHTAYSFDANADGARSTPQDAYRFAKGARVGVSPYDADGKPRRTAQLERPIDFAAVTDHAEMLGEIRVCRDPGADGYGSLPCLLLRNAPGIGFRLFGWKTLYAKERFDLCGENGAGCRAAAGTVWGELAAAAEEAYDRSPACRFTSFLGYEWTGTVGMGQNLHRNVIFRNARVPEQPVSWTDSTSALDLWRQLEAGCVKGIPGCDALTIPHNSNLSGGLMFESAAIGRVEDAGSEIGAAEAKQRARWEPLVEIFQHKGDSECGAGAGWSDEDCGWEKLPYDNFGAQTNPLAERRNAPRASFVRAALAKGLRVERDLGANPFRFGVIGSTDTHIATPGLTEERGFPGHSSTSEGSGEGAGARFNDDFEFNPGGLAVLWAEENTRDALFAAMQRREAYATSGTRPLVRFFGGWGYDPALCNDPQFLAKSYVGGVPMGGVLPARPANAGAPVFVASALRDTGTASRRGTPLQRIQVVKGWLDAQGKTYERVLDVAGGPNEASVELATCEPRGAGAAALCSVWSDPAFDLAAPAFYYARVLENPTCRWTQQVCVAARVNCREPGSVPEELAQCCAPEHRPVQQERAWTSPIWYSPAGAERPLLPR